MKVMDRYIQLRFGGLPVSTVEQITNPDLSILIEELGKLHRFFDFEREKISSTLHEIIGMLDPMERASVVAFRRELYKGNFSQAEKFFTKITTQNQALLRKMAASLIEHLESLNKIYDTILDDFEIFLNYERCSLTSLGSNSSFMSGIALASPSLVPAISRMSNNVMKNMILDKQDKKAERSFHTYVLRTATKTSLFSTLGLVSLIDNKTGKPATHACMTKPSVYPIARVLNKLLDNPLLVSNLNIILSPYMNYRKNIIEVERATWTFVDNKDNTDLANYNDSTIQLKLTQSIQVIYSLLKNRTMTVSELVDKFTKSTGISSKTARELIVNLIRLGYLLIPELELHPYDTKQMNTIISHISKDNTELSGVFTDYIEKSETLSEVINIVDRISKINELKALTARMYDMVEVAGETPRSVVYEDKLVDDVCVNGCFDSEVAETTFRKLITLIDLLDQANVSRSLMRGYFLSKNIQSMDAHSFIRGFIDDLFTSFSRYGDRNVTDNDLPVDPWLRWGDAWKWVKARRSLQAKLLQYSKIVPIGTTLDFDPAKQQIDISSIIEKEISLPATPSFRHINLLAQRTSKGEWIINNAFGGIGFQISRFTHLVDNPQLYTRDIELLAESCGIRLAEISGGALFSNLNFHEPILSTRIILPGEPVRDYSNKDRIEALDLVDLKVSIDEKQDCLTLYDEDFTISPVYSGYLVPTATPLKNQVINLFSASMQMTYKLSDLLFPKPEPGMIAVIPRFILDNLTLARARIIINTEDLPKASPLTSTGYKEWLQKWLSMGLPSRCFIRLRDNSRQSHKPSFFDIRQILSCSTLAHKIKQLSKTAFLEIEELLPRTPIDTYQNSSTVSEYMIGMTWSKDK